MPGIGGARAARILELTLLDDLRPEALRGPLDVAAAYSWSAGCEPTIRNQRVHFFHDQVLRERIGEHRRGSARRG